MNTTTLSALGAAFVMGAGASALAAVLLYGRIFDRLWQRAWTEVSVLFPGMALPHRTRALAYVHGTPRPKTLAEWPINKVDNGRDIAWHARNLVEPLACPYADDTMDISRDLASLNLAREQNAEQFSEQPNAVLLPAARLAGRLAAAIRRWVQGRREWWRTATAQWQDTEPGQHRHDGERATGGVR